MLYIGNRTISPWTISPKTASPWEILPENFYLVLLYCSQIITPGLLMPRTMTITTYNFSMAVFSFFSIGQLYNFCYGNKNNNDNFPKQNNFLKRFGNIEINGIIRIRLVSSLTLHLAYRIFGSKTHHTISSALKISVSGKVGDVLEKRNRKLKKEQGF